MTKENPIALELLWRYGKTEFAPWLSGVRRIVAVRSYGFDLEILSTEGLTDQSQKTSQLRVKRAAQFLLEGDILSIHNKEGELALQYKVHHLPD